MIVLITGASHTGKTLLAQKVLERYGFPYLSIDHLKMGLIRSGYTALTPEDDDALTEYLWPVVREIIRTAAENKQDLTVEGCYVPPAWRSDLGECCLPSVRFVCLAMTEEYIEDHYEDIVSHESEIESRLTPCCGREELKADNRKVIEGFRAAGETVTLIGEDFERTMQALTDRIMSAG